jgi:hypothetical protein
MVQPSFPGLAAPGYSTSIAVDDFDEARQQLMVEAVLSNGSGGDAIEN